MCGCPPLKAYARTTRADILHTTGHGGQSCQSRLHRDKRPPGGGGGYHQHIYLDGKRIASVRPGERLELNIPSGHHQFSIKRTDPFGQNKLFTINEKLEGGKHYLYRIVADSNNKESRLERTGPDDAKRLDDED